MSIRDKVWEQCDYLRLGEFNEAFKEAMKSPVVIQAIAIVIRRNHPEERYQKCPACGGLDYCLIDNNVKQCSDCEAIFGEVVRLVFKSHVLRWVNPEEDQEAVRYYDFVVEENGERYHGWINKDGLVVQTG